MRRVIGIVLVIGFGLSNCSSKRSFGVQHNNAEGYKVHTIEMVEDLALISAEDGDVVNVKEVKRGGAFIYSAEGSTFDNGIFFKAANGGCWSRKYEIDQGVHPEWYGAIGDGKNDDGPAMIRCISENNLVVLKADADYRAHTLNTIDVRNRRCFIKGNGSTIRNFSFEVRPSGQLKLTDLTMDNNGVNRRCFAIGSVPQLGKDNKPCSRSSFENCQFISSIYKYEANRLYCDNFSATNCIWDGNNNIEIYGGDNILFDQCIFKDQNSDDNLVIKGLQYNTKKFVPKKSVTNLEIKNCTVYEGNSLLAIGTQVYDTQVENLRVHHNIIYNTSNVVNIKIQGDNGNPLRNIRSTYYLDGVVKNVEIHHNYVKSAPVYIDSLKEVYESHCINNRSFPSDRQRYKFEGILGLALNSGQVISNIYVHDNYVRGRQSDISDGFNYIGSVTNFTIDYNQTSTVAEKSTDLPPVGDVISLNCKSSQFTSGLKRIIEKEDFTPTLTSIKDNNRVGAYWVINSISKPTAGRVSIDLKRISVDDLKTIFGYPYDDYKTYIYDDEGLDIVKGDKFVLGYVPVIVDFKLENIWFTDLNPDAEQNMPLILEQPFVKQNRINVKGGSEIFRNKMKWNWDKIYYNGVQNMDYGLRNTVIFE